MIEVAHKIDLAHRRRHSLRLRHTAPIEIRVAHARDRYALRCDPQIAHPADIYAQIVRLDPAVAQLENGDTLRL